MNDIDIDDLEWKIDYLKAQYNLDEQIVEDEAHISEEEKEFFDEEMTYLKEWINELKDEMKKTAKKKIDMKSSKEINKEGISWKIEFLKNSLESVEEALYGGQKLDESDKEFLEEDIKNLKKWIEDLQKVLIE